MNIIHLQLKNYIIYTSVALLSAILLALTALTPLTGYADTQADYDENNRQLDKLKQEQAALSSELDDLNSQLEASGNSLNNITTRISSKQHEIDTLNSNISDMEAEKQRQYDAMKLRIQYMYESNDYSFMDVLMKSTDMADLLKKADYARQISDYDRSMLADLNNLITSLNQNKVSLNNDMTELVSLQQQAVAQSESIKSLIGAKQSKIDANSEGIKNAEALALEYEKKLEEEAAARQLEEIKKLSSADEIINNTPISYDTSDLAMMAAIIECEAGNQSYEGKLAVGSVVVNRVNSPRFANSISGVIYASGQFTPVASGRFTIVLSRGASASCVQAAQEVLNGNVTINALYFHVYRSGIDTYGTVIGDHIFY